MDSWLHWSVELSSGSQPVTFLRLPKLAPCKRSTFSGTIIKLLSNKEASQCISTTILNPGTKWTLKGTRPGKSETISTWETPANQISEGTGPRIAMSPILGLAAHFQHSTDRLTTLQISQKASMTRRAWLRAIYSTAIIIPGISSTLGGRAGISPRMTTSRSGSIRRAGDSTSSLTQNARSGTRVFKTPRRREKKITRWSILKISWS